MDEYISILAEIIEEHKEVSKNAQGWAILTPDATDALRGYARTVVAGSEEIARAASAELEYTPPPELERLELKGKLARLEYLLKIARMRLLSADKTKK